MNPRSPLMTRRSYALSALLRSGGVLATAGACWLAPAVAHAARSTACQSGAGQAGSFDHYSLSAQTVSANGIKRNYLLAVPNNLDLSTPVALVFGWHSLAAEPADARSMLDLEQYARGRAIFVYPEAIYAPEQDTVRWDLTVDGKSPALGNGNDIALFDAIVAALGSRYCFETSQIFSAGFSAGGFLTNTLACYRGSSLRAVGIIAGKLEVPPEWAKTPCTDVPVAAWMAHGTSDGVVPIAVGKAARDHWVSLAQCSASTSAVTPAPCRAYDGCSAGHPITWCEHNESDAWGPHLVPSFAPQAMWSFFASFLDTAPPAPVPTTTPTTTPTAVPTTTPTTTPTATPTTTPTDDPAPAPRPPRRRRFR